MIISSLSIGMKQFFPVRPTKAARRAARLILREANHFNRVRRAHRGA